MGRRNVEADMYSQLLASLHMSDISTVSVKHCPNAFGVALRHCDGWKVTYSGDTMPCDELVQLGMYNTKKDGKKLSTVVPYYGLIETTYYAIFLLLTVI
jgi:hypothetical protein